jgi:hypothetical protein
MRINLPDSAQADTPVRYQAMFDTQVGFRDHLERMLGKKVEILVNAPRQGVLDGDYGESGGFLRHRFENIFKGATGNRPDRRAEYLAHRAMAESPRLALKSHPRSRRYMKHFLQAGKSLGPFGEDQTGR